MKFWFNPEKKGFNQLGDFVWIDTDYRTVNTKLFFDELKILPIDGGGYLLGFNLLTADNLSDKIESKIFPLPCALWLHPKGTKYEIYSLDDRKKVEVESTPLEQVVIKALELVDSTKVYKGALDLVASPMNAKVLDNPETLVAMNPLFLVEIPEAKVIGGLRLESSKVGGSTGSKTYKPAQTEKSKLDDRLLFALELGKELYGESVTDVASLYANSAADPDLNSFYLSMLKTLI